MAEGVIALLRRRAPVGEVAEDLQDVQQLSLPPTFRYLLLLMHFLSSR